MFFFLALLALAFFLPPKHSFSQKSQVASSTEQQAEKDRVTGQENETRGDYNQASHFYNKAANAYWAHGQLDKAQELFTKALSMSERIGNRNAIYVLNTNLGLIKAELGNTAEGIKNLLKANEVAVEMGRKPDVAASLVNLANILFEVDRLNEAIDKLTQAESLAQELNDSKLLRNIYSILTKVYDKVGKREESAKYFNLFAALTQKIQREEMQVKEQEAQKMVSQAKSRVQAVEAEKQATEQELEVRDMELVQKQKLLEQTEQISREQLMQIDLLNKERELQQAIISHQNQMRNVYLTIICLVVAFALYIYYSYQQKKKANLLLQHKNAEISRQNVEIQEQAEQLRNLNQLKDKLFSIISHDLRSPLGSLLTLLNLTRQGYFTEEGFKEVIEELSKNVGYTTELIENLLKWAQSQMQGLKVSPSYFKPFDVANEKFKYYVEKASSKGIELKNLIDPSIEAYADSSMIELVMRNLIANSIKFCNSGDTITTNATIDGHRVVITVVDTGSGIKPENMDKLFGRENFSTPGTQNEKGTGLGLILCKDFVTLNRGSIWAKSTYGKGCEFSFAIPLQP